MDYQELTPREVQLGAYEVLKKLIDICDSHDWRYFLAYGSMLGAVRHKGVIPWDDDIDIMMPRPDYEKLRSYFLENAASLYPLKLFDQTAVPAYPHMIARISDQRYHLIFDNEIDYGIGLFVDIYPVDGVGCNYETAVKHVRKNKRTASLCFLTSRKSYSMDNTDSKIKMLIKFPAYLWANCMGNRHYIKKLTKAAQAYDYDSSQYVACAAWPAGKKRGIERDVFEKAMFEDLIEVPFEDTTVKIPKEYDKFLTVTYGDYMLPPSEAGKKTNHTYLAYKLHN